MPLAAAVRSLKTREACRYSRLTSSWSQPACRRVWRIKPRRDHALAQGERMPHRTNRRGPNLCEEVVLDEDNFG